MRPDQTSFCAACSHRFATADRCPQCGASSFALTTGEGRRHAARALRRRWRAKHGKPTAGLGVLMAGIGLTIAALAALAIVGTWVLFIVTLTAALSVGLTSWRRHHPPVDTGGYPMFRIELYREPPPDTPGPTGRASIRGIVRAGETVTAPLCGEQVVAFRLLGSTLDGPVDEADVRGFEIVTPDGAHPAVVDTSGAIVDLAPARPPRPISLSPELAVYLHNRSVFRPKPPIRLTEALLRNGDEVEVEGLVTDHATPGYRDAGWQKRVAGTDDAPLVIRSPR